MDSELRQVQKTLKFEAFFHAQDFKHKKVLEKRRKTQNTFPIHLRLSMRPVLNHRHYFIDSKLQLIYDTRCGTQSTALDIKVQVRLPYSPSYGLSINNYAYMIYWSESLIVLFISTTQGQGSSMYRKK